MHVQSTQIRVTLPIPLQDYLQSRADTFGLTLPAYIKNLLISEAREMEARQFSSYLVSDQAVEKLNQAKQEEKIGQLKAVRDVDDFFQKL
jgi:hypothetical protein